MCFSNKVQVKHSLPENFSIKNLWKRDKGFSLQKVFRWPDIKKKGL